MFTRILCTLGNYLVDTRGDGRGVGNKDDQEKLTHAQRDSMYKDCPHVASRRSANPIQLIVSLLSEGNNDEDEVTRSLCSKFRSGASCSSLVFLGVTSSMVITFFLPPLPSLTTTLPSMANGRLSYGSLVTRQQHPLWDPHVTTLLVSLQQSR
jgi:hypothetical protein